MKLESFLEEMSKTAMSYSTPLMKSFFSLRNFANTHAPIGTKARLSVLRNNMKKAVFNNDTKLMTSTHDELGNITKTIAKAKGVKAPEPYKSKMPSMSSPIKPIKPSSGGISVSSPTSFGTGVHKRPTPSLALGSWR